MRLKLGQFAKIDVYLHWTLFVLPFVLVTIWRFHLKMDWPTIGYMSGLVGSAFLCVVLHEFGHALTARRFEIPTRDILLTPIGGLARLEGLSRDPRQELIITIAGPTVNLLIATALALTIWGLGWTIAPSPQAAPIAQFLPMVMWLNLALFVFNLFPAFPMDGGRILRSGLALFLDFKTATKIATMTGRLLAIFFVAIGLYLPQYSLAIIGAFIFVMATVEVRSLDG